MLCLFSKGYLQAYWKKYSVEPKYFSWRSPYRTHKMLDCLWIEVVKVNLQQNMYHMVPTIFGVSKINFYQIFHRHFDHVSPARFWCMAKKDLVKCVPTHLLGLEEPFPIFILTKETNITISPTIDLSKFSPDFMLQLYFPFFGVESICWFTSTLLGVWSDTSYPFVFPVQNQNTTSLHFEIHCPYIK